MVIAGTDAGVISVPHMQEALLILDDEPETDKEQASVASSLADASPDIPFEQLRRIRA